MISTAITPGMASTELLAAGDDVQRIELARGLADHAVLRRVARRAGLRRQAGLQAGLRDQRLDEGLEGADRRRAAGELVVDQLGLRVGRQHLHLVQRDAGLLGNHHRQRGTNTGTLLQARHLEGVDAVAAERELHQRHGRRAGLHDRVGDVVVVDGVGGCQRQRCSLRVRRRDREAAGQRRTRGRGQKPASRDTA
ncbi:MAG: hypothetical protein OSW77_12665 [Proteobacteria bacterium]|nr:hypothetical protein [Pseudomonadota bacterium]